MLKLDLKVKLSVLLLPIILIIGKYLINNYFELNTLNKKFILSLVVLILLIIFFNKMKNHLSLKPLTKIKNIVYILPFLIFFIIRNFMLDYTVLEDGKSTYIFFIVLVVFIQCFFEEFFFRGVLINNYIKNGINIRKSIIYSSIIFGLFHMVNMFKVDDFFSLFNQIVVAIFIGILFGSLFVLTKNIYLISLLHALINFPTYIKVVISKTATTVSQNTFMEDVISTIMMMLIYSPLLIIGLFFINRIEKQYNKSKSIDFQNEKPFII